MIKYIQMAGYGILLGFLLMLSGCGGQGFSLKSLAKTDIDMVADAHYQEAELLLKELTIKLYKRNPRYLHSETAAVGQEYMIDNRVQQLFGSTGKLYFAELPVLGVDAIELALDPSFEGDRIFALMAGLTSMVRQSYGYQSEFFIYSDLDGQRLYHSARNLEIAFWRVTTYQDESGVPLILTNSINGEMQNLSYERLFGKLIALQDILAKIIAGKSQRMIKTVAQNVATMAFFPI
ncbi:MAG: hypothetical protein QNK31_03995 [Porticoccus sp.]|nr:hypothetical protein [Porticoccus sp.]